jgi:hypothetical protein
MADEVHGGEPTVAPPTTASDDQPKKLPKGVVLGKDGKP